MELSYRLVLEEIDSCLNSSDYSELAEFVSSIATANQIVCYGAGRVGLAMKGFAKRLGHLGKTSYFLEDSTLPALGRGDLLIIGSGSGSTKSVLTIAQVASRHSIKIILITANRNSEIGNLATSTILLNAPTKQPRSGVYLESKQPMTTLFEQALFIFCDALVLNLMQVLGQTSTSMKERHNVLE